MKYLLILFGIVSSMLQAQENPSVQVISRTQQDRVLLRWAVDQPQAWKEANTLGFLIERSTISRNGEAVVPIEKNKLVHTPLKPQPLEAWETLATQDQNAAILAQALYGDRFETSSPGEGLGAIYAVNEELEQRFTFGLLAAEQNYEAAKLAGWAFEDTSAKKGEQYVYTISVAQTLEGTPIIENGTVYSSLDDFEPLPKPIGFFGLFEDNHANLSWNFNLLQELYTNYSIERSEDNSVFEQLNAAPIFSVQESNGPNGTSLSYTDSIPNNKTFYYRIKGKTAFGETSPPSDVVSGKAQENLAFSPRITRKEIPTDSTATLFWEFDQKGNDLITGFEVHRANSDAGPFEVVKKNISTTARTTTISGLKRVNYFTVVALGKNGVKSESFATMIQPIDSTPPLPPIGLSAALDTTGILRLSWNKNAEEDLKGYRIFTANNPDVEFNEITSKTHVSEIFLDTIPINNLNKKIYFKIKAEDFRYNQSKFSEILMVEKPDVSPPSPPFFKRYSSSTDGIALQWTPSSSTDVNSQIIYRKNNAKTDALWEQITELKSALDSTYTDKSLQTTGSYSYTIIAKDKVGLESSVTEALTLFWNGKEIQEGDIKFSGIVDRELRFINLSWKMKDMSIVEYRLYRGTTKDDLKLYKVIDGSSKGYNDTSLEINTDYWYGLQAIWNGGRTSPIKEINLKY